MAEDKKSIVVYADWINSFEELEDAEAGRLIKHFFRYVNDKNPEPPDRLTKLLFEPIKQTLKRDLVKYEDKREKNRQNALLRWNKNDAAASDGIKLDANHADSDSVNDSVNDSVSDNGIDINSIIEIYNNTSFSKVEKLTKMRMSHLKARIKEYSIQTVIDVIQRADKSDFLKGKNDRNWKANFDFIIKPEKFVKILEGFYDNKKERQVMP